MPTLANVPVTRALLDAMPKSELHLHLEGAIPLQAMWGMVQRHGGTEEVPDPEALASRFHYRDFDHFLRTWVWKLGFHRDYEDYKLIGESVAADLVRQNIVYVEAHVSPGDAHRHGLATGELMRAVRRGIDRIEGVEIRLVPDLVRNYGPAVAERTLEEIIEVAEETGVIGVTIGGSEAEFPAELFTSVYRRAAEAGLHRTAHAGEAAGPQSIRAAIDLLGVERIGHGVRAVEDPGLVAWLVVNGMPLEVCPSSNLRTGVARDWETHPVRTLIDVGANVTINSDDPAMFGCSLAGDYQALASELGYGFDTVIRLAHNTIEASWAPDSRKAQLRERLDEWAVGAAAGPS